MSVDAGFNVDIDTMQGREQPQQQGRRRRPGRQGAQKQRFKPVSFADFYKRYNYVANLIAAYPELQDYYNQILEYYNSNNGQMPPANWLKEKRVNNPFFQARNSNQEEFDFAEQDPALRDDVEAAIKLNRDKIVRWAAQRGIDLPADKVEELSRDATRNKWADDDVQLEKNLGIFIGSAAGKDMRGTAGDYQRQLEQWVRKNGINMSPEAISQFVERLTFQRQTIEDAKQEIRDTYMLGAYPAWEDKIRAGIDPDSLASPYRSRIAQLLEVDEEQVGWDDPLLKKAMQNVGADGKPRVLPLYELDREVRADPRWEFTDNAYDVYSRVGTNLLRTFGFR